jgi:hypothetical protein
LLNEIGVSAVEFDSIVSAADLHQFVMQMLVHRNRIKGALDFQHVVIGGMPSTITVVHREFVARDFAANDGPRADGGDSTNPSMETLLATLLKHGLTPQEIARCRKLLEAVPGYLRDYQPDGASLPQVTWTDVEKLLLRAAKQQSVGAGDGTGGSRVPGSNLDALAAIFTALGAQAATTDTRQAIDLMVALSRRSQPAAPEPEVAATSAPAPTPAAAPAAAPQPSAVFDLRAALADRADKSGIAPLQTAENRCELLTILLQLLTRDQKPQVQLRIQKQLRDILRTQLLPSERVVAVEGVRHLLSLGAVDRLHGALRIIMEALGSSEHSLPLRFLCDVCRDRPRPELVEVWPFLVNEILLTGGRRDEEVFREACEVAAMPTPEEMQGCLAVLESLEALRDRRCVRDAFAPPPSELYPVFAVLLHSPFAPFIGDQLLSGLRFKPLSWLSEAVLPMLGRFQPKHRRLLVDILKLGVSDDVPPDMAEAAAHIIADALPTLPRANRREPWVRAAVGAIARLPVPGAGQILRDILHSRHFVVVHEWPEDSRRAAREALATIRARAT